MGEKELQRNMGEKEVDKEKNFVLQKCISQITIHNRNNM